MLTRLISTQLPLALLAGCLLACNSADKSTTRTPTSVTPPETTVNTESVMEHPIAPPPAFLSTQKGPAGSQVDLLKAQVKGNTLTVELQYKSGDEDNPIESTYAIDQVGVIDEMTAKRYRVLKDQSGKYVASPLRTDQRKQLISINIHSSKDKPVLVWFKFPAPPVGTKTISIMIPEVGTYQGIPLSR